MNKKNYADIMYLDLVSKIINDGDLSGNKRTGQLIRTIPHHTFTYEPESMPIITSKKVNFKGAIAEMLGYLAGHTNVREFEKLGTKTWTANANDKNWLVNPNCTKDGSLGKIYGWKMRHGIHGRDILKNIVDRIILRDDNRRLILDFWSPELEDQQCLPACLYNHQFIITGDTLHLTSIQRSTDVALGLPYNMVQVSFLLRMMAHICGLEVGTAVHHMSNVHLYHGHIPTIQEQMKNKVSLAPVGLGFGADIYPWRLISNELSPSNFSLLGYEPTDSKPKYELFT